MLKTLLLAPSLLVMLTAAAPRPAEQVELGRRTAPLIEQDGLAFKDLDRNHRLDSYEDWRLPAAVRARDLVARMTLEEKAGVLMHGTPPGQGGELRAPWDLAAFKPWIQQRHVRFFIHRVSGKPRDLAEMANAAQAMAEDSRLGVPIVFSSDPRNHFQAALGVSVSAGQFSQWPETTGMAAIRDPALVRDFGRIAAREYRAVGITMALSPMADLATEPRWPRINGTFGDDPELTGKLVEAYVEGFQGGREGPGPNGVATVVKHWVGYGAQPAGYDAHNPYGKDIAFPGGRFQQHVQPFLGAFDAKVSGVMPTYGRPPEGLLINGRQAERVGAGFSRQMVTDLLRGTYAYKGFVLTDWKITDDCDAPCVNGTLHHDEVGMPWGVETLSKSERFAKGIDAGVDQFGGVMDADILTDLVRSGRVSQTRLDESARRMLELTFELGLFENPYVDPAGAEAVVGDAAARAAALDAQRRSLVLLENSGGLLPLSADKRPKVWLWKVSKAAAEARGFQVVDRPEDADVTLLRIVAPFKTRPQYFFGSRHHEGGLAFAEDNADRQAVERASAATRTIVSAYLDRPAILTPIRARANVLIADFGASDEALLDMLTGDAPFQGRLPFELPSSEAAVEAQLPDVPADSADPLYRTGFGRNR
ncbi:glycoside hydrolase family 3 N-terminal domain-containing protein [Caulobacter sp. CCNWLY153]|uniref:glycoside hydrolase family 3 protein n=1 Tax=unclassified Caulobacter TaxID=2648921 RepID=UPI002FEF3F51